jgi:hypothetical protein
MTEYWMSCRGCRAKIRSGEMVDGCGPFCPSCARKYGQKNSRRDPASPIGTAACDIRAGDACCFDFQTRLLSPINAKKPRCCKPTK